MSLKLITAPSGLVVSLVECKAHLRIDTTDDDTLLTAMIGAATEAAEQMTGRAMMTQTWEVSLDAFPSAIDLTRVPVQSIISITYIDTAGALQTLSALLYSLHNADDFGFSAVSPVYAGEWPAVRGDVDGVKVRYVAGYASAAAVPESIKSWIKLQVGAMHEGREAEVIGNGSAISLGFADRLLDRYKVYA